MEENKKNHYIALLRGINVGGHTVKMDRLRELFIELGFHNVRSYIQTGNIFFESNDDKQILRGKIEEHLQTALGYTVVVCLRSLSELKQLLQLDPFKGVTITPEIRLAVTFLAQPAQVALSVPYLTPDGGYELVGMTKTELFVIWHLKNGKPATSYNLLGNKIQVQNTTRFWHTTAKILSAAENN